MAPSVRSLGTEMLALPGGMMVLLQTLLRLTTEGLRGMYLDHRGGREGSSAISIWTISAGLIHPPCCCLSPALTMEDKTLPLKATRSSPCEAVDNWLSPMLYDNRYQYWMLGIDCMA